MQVEHEKTTAKSGIKRGNDEQDDDPTMPSRRSERPHKVRRTDSMEAFATYEKTSCAACLEPEDPEMDDDDPKSWFIQCGVKGCKLWYHYECVNIFDEADVPDAFVCPAHKSQ